MGLEDYLEEDKTHRELSPIQQVFHSTLQNFLAPFSSLVLQPMTSLFGSVSAVHVVDYKYKVVQNDYSHSVFLELCLEV